MAHKVDRHDVDALVARYRELTGDVDAVLLRDRGEYALRGRYKYLDAYGKGFFVLVLERFCDGWEAGRKCALEDILGEKVPRLECET